MDRFTSMLPHENSFFIGSLPCRSELNDFLFFKGAPGVTGSVLKRIIFLFKFVLESRL